MKSFITKNLALAAICHRATTSIMFLCLSVCLAQASDDSDTEDQGRDTSMHTRKQGHHFSDECSSQGYSIKFENHDCSVERRYNKQHIPTETLISSSKPVSCKITEEIVRIIFCMDRIETPQRHEPREFIHEREHNHRELIQEPRKLIHDLVHEVRDIGRDCIEAMPWPISYFLGFRPIKSVLNCIFPHHQHKCL